MNTLYDFLQLKKSEDLDGYIEERLNSDLSFPSITISSLFVSLQKDKNWLDEALVKLLPYCNHWVEETPWILFVTFLETSPNTQRKMVTHIKNSAERFPQTIKNLFDKAWKGWVIYGSAYSEDDFFENSKILIEKFKVFFEGCNFWKPSDLLDEELLENKMQSIKAGDLSWLLSIIELLSPEIEYQQNNVDFQSVLLLPLLIGYKKHTLSEADIHSGIICLKKISAEMKLSPDAVFPLSKKAQNYLARHQLWRSSSWSIRKVIDSTWNSPNLIQKGELVCDQFKENWLNKQLIPADEKSSKMKVLNPRF